MNQLLENWEEFLNEAKLKHGYSIGEIGKDPIAGIDQNKSMYGASMNKPVLAFINLVLAKEGALHNRTGEKMRRLSPEELDKLISYSGGSSNSNRVNRALSDMSSVPGKDPKNQGYYKKYSKQYGVSRDQAKEVLNKLGLSDSIGGVHWGSKYNQQTPQGYNNFMSLLIKMKNDPNSEYHSEANEVLSYVQKRQGGQGAKGLKDRLNKQLEKAGYGKDSIKSMYGKGGYNKGTLNYSVVINDKYVLSLYTDQSNRDLGKMRSKIQDLTLGAIKDNIKPEQFHTPLQTKVPDRSPAPATTATPSPVATAVKPAADVKMPPDWWVPGQRHLAPLKARELPMHQDGPGEAALGNLLDMYSIKSGFDGGLSWDTEQEILHSRRQNKGEWDDYSDYYSTLDTTSRKKVDDYVRQKHREMATALEAPARAERERKDALYWRDNPEKAAALGYDIETPIPPPRKPETPQALPKPDVQVASLPPEPSIEDPLPIPAPIKTRSGRFVHDIEELPDFDFDKFYGDLDVQFADQGGATAMLPGHGTDYKFGREHQKAYQELQKARELEKPPTSPEPALKEAYKRWARLIK